MAFPRSPRTSSAFQSTRSSVLDTTYFFAASIVRAKGSIQVGIQSGLTPVRAGRDHCTMIAASVQRDVDGISKGTHYHSLSGLTPALSRGPTSEARRVRRLERLVGRHYLVEGQARALAWRVP